MGVVSEVGFLLVDFCVVVSREGDSEDVFFEVVCFLEFLTAFIQLKLLFFVFVFWRRKKH